ncbi:hypothetical protein GIB67_023781 [Kingdonia uniflora]|uniref:Uncharacterized protein n=1 Tax=Kingdonia uniflora TaxID=39325 RepID=A0A7J7NNL8_9MAGN|nr:hypothetical protein GIB67_023781 [Kingdonia uniflora]
MSLFHLGIVRFLLLWVFHLDSTSKYGVCGFKFFQWRILHAQGYLIQSSSLFDSKVCLSFIWVLLDFCFCGSFHFDIMFMKMGSVGLGFGVWVLHRQFLIL